MIWIVKDTASLLFPCLIKKIYRVTGVTIFPYLNVNMIVMKVTNIVLIKNVTNIVVRTQIHSLFLGTKSIGYL